MVRSIGKASQERGNQFLRNHGLNIPYENASPASIGIKLIGKAAKILALAHPVSDKAGVGSISKMYMGYMSSEGDVAPSPSFVNTKGDA